MLIYCIHGQSSRPLSTRRVCCRHDACAVCSRTCARSDERRIAMHASRPLTSGERQDGQMLEKRCRDTHAHTDDRAQRRSDAVAYPVAGVLGNGGAAGTAGAREGAMRVHSVVRTRMRTPLRAPSARTDTCARVRVRASVCSPLTRYSTLQSHGGIDSLPDSCWTSGR